MNPRGLPRSAARVLALIAALAGVLLVSASGMVEAFAQEATDSFRLRAFDRTAMIDAQGEDRSMKDVPMRPGALKCLVLGGSATAQFDAAIAADGSITIPRASVPQGSTITLRAELPGAGTYVATGIDLWGEPASERAEFVRMATSMPLYVPFGNLVVTGQDVGSPSAYVRVNVIAQVANPSSELWTGPRDGTADDALRFPVPAGFKVVSAKRGNDDVDCKLVTDAAGRCEAVIAGGMFPPQTQSLYRIVLTGKFEKGARYDLSFRTALDVGEWNLVIDPVVFSYDTAAGGGQALFDGGMRPGVNGIETRVWLLRDIPAGTAISQVFVQGRIIDPKVWRTIAIFALTAAGAVLLARALAGGRNAKSDASAPAVKPNSGADEARESALEDLVRRHKRGEMTEFEFNARKAMLSGPARRVAGPTTDPTAPPPPRTPATGKTSSSLDRIAEIEARAGTADEAQLRADVGTLAALAREHLRK